MKSKRGTYVLICQLCRHPGLSQACLGRWGQTEVLRSRTASWLDCLGTNPAPPLTSSDFKKRENTRPYLVIVKRIKLAKLLKKSKCYISSISEEAEPLFPWKHAVPQHKTIQCDKNIRLNCMKLPKFDHFLTYKNGNFMWLSQIGMNKNAKQCVLIHPKCLKQLRSIIENPSNDCLKKQIKYLWDWPFSCSLVCRTLWRLSNLGYLERWLAAKLSSSHHLLLWQQ